MKAVLVMVLVSLSTGEIRHEPIQTDARSIQACYIAGPQIIAQAMPGALDDEGGPLPGLQLADTPERWKMQTFKCREG